MQLVRLAFSLAALKAGSNKPARHGYDGNYHQQFDQGKGAGRGWFCGAPFLVEERVPSNRMSRNKIIMRVDGLAGPVLFVVLSSEP